MEKVTKTHIFCFSDGLGKNSVVISRFCLILQKRCKAVILNTYLFCILKDFREGLNACILFRLGKDNIKPHSLGAVALQGVDKTCSHLP